MNYLKILVALSLLVSLGVSAFADWPAWRGPNGNGIGSAENLPVEWTVDSNVSWKVKLPSWSGASPIVVGDKVFVVSPSKQEAPPPADPAPGRRGRRPAPPPGCLLYTSDAADE